MDPGRKRVEERELEFVAVGEDILTAEGVRWTVTSHVTHGDRVTLALSRMHGDREMIGTMTGHHLSTVSVRNNLTSQS